MSGWVFLSDSDAARIDAPPQLVRGALVFELAWPLPTGVLLDWHDGAGSALSVFHHPQSGIGVLRRQGDAVWRHRLAGPLATDARIARLLFRWDATTGLWSLRLDDTEGRILAATRGLNATALPGPMLAALCRGQGVARRDGAVLWFGVTDSPAPPPNRPWIGRATPVPTVTGPVPAAGLRPGDWILTRDAGPVPLRALHAFELPSRGSHAAIILRAPYFARGCDLLVSASQRIAVGGLEVDYLFGMDEVLVSAGLLADGRMAMADNRRVSTAAIALDLGEAHLIDIQGCTLLTALPAAAAAPPPLPVLDDAEAAPLMALLRRMRPAA